VECDFVSASKIATSLASGLAVGRSGTSSIQLKFEVRAWRKRGAFEQS